MKNGRYEEDGTVRWYLNDHLHREDGPAVEWANGSKEWWINGQLHREDGPAVETSDGHRQWCLNGKKHRSNGPAIEWSDGLAAWYLNGVEQTQQEFQQWLDRKNLNEKLHATLEPKPTEKRLKI